MTPYEYVKCYRREQFSIPSTNSVSPQRIETAYQYSPLEVRKPKRTTIAVVTAAICGPSIFSMYVIRSLHKRNFRIKKGHTEQIHCSHSVFPSLLFHHPKKAAGGGNSLWPSPSCCRSQSSLFSLPLAPGAPATRKARATIQVEEKGCRISRGWVEGGDFPFSPDPSLLSYTITIDASRTRHRNRPNSPSFFQKTSPPHPHPPPAVQTLLPPCRLQHNYAYRGSNEIPDGIYIYCIFR